MIRGERASTRSADGTVIATVTAGRGPSLLLVHGGMVSSTRWGPLWPLLTRDFRVTAMDRRGRGGSSDGRGHSLRAEAEDVVAVTRRLAGSSDGPVAVFGHSYGALCALAAVGDGCPVSRLALYEPPGPQTVPTSWIDEVRQMLQEGQVGRAVVSFLIHVVGFTPEQVAAARHSPAGEESLTVAARTLVREAEAIRGTDVRLLAGRVDVPVLLLLGTLSPGWATAVTQELASALPCGTVVPLPGSGHEAVDDAPAVVAEQIRRFLLPPRVPTTSLP